MRILLRHPSSSEIASDDELFFWSRALHARALRFLGHPDFKDQENGSTHGDAIPDPDSTPDPNIGPTEKFRNTLVTPAPTYKAKI